MTYLDKLIEAVENGDTSFISEHEYASIRIGSANAGTIRAAYYGGLDAALALHEALLPDHLWSMSPLGKVSVLDKSFNVIAESGYNGSEARAWLIAILKAYRSFQCHS